MKIYYNNKYEYFLSYFCEKVTHLTTISLHERYEKVREIWRRSRCKKEEEYCQLF